MNIELTNIWKINNTLVVADYIEDAILIYKTKNQNEPINCIEKVTNSGNGCAIMNNNTSEELEAFIERASNWLRTILMDNHDGYKIVSTIDFANMDDFINNFKDGIR
jgi:hypothetical protein